MRYESPHLPAYEASIDAYHRAFETELRHVVSTLPLPPSPRILDVGCGDGFYSGLLADRLGADGRLTAVDVSDDYLQVAGQRLRGHGRAAQIECRKENIRKLTFPHHAFDVAWCGQSFYSLPDPVEALKEMRRVVRPGGTVIVFENDTLHHLLLPWPPDVELAVRTAELAHYRERFNDPEKFYIGRALSELFSVAGLMPEHQRTFAWDRRFPFDPSCRDFLSRELLGIRERIHPHLSAVSREGCERYLDPASALCCLNDPNAGVTVLDRLTWGRR